MKNKSLLFRALALVAALSCALGASAYDFQSGNVYYNITGTNTVEVTTKSSYGMNYSGTVSIPSTVTNDGKTYTVTAIGRSAFLSCHDLTEVQLPTTIELIDTMAFYYCKGLKSITIPEGVTTIAKMNFYVIDSLRSVDLPSTLRTIEVFSFNSCPKLSSFTCRATTPPSADISSFYRLADDCVLYVPESAIGAYMVADGWCDRFSNIQAIDAYACYTPSNTTLTFYYDNQRNSRPGTTYDLNTGSNDTGWDTDGTKDYVTKVVFDPSFANARPTTTYDWFCQMVNLQSISGMSYLNTSQVTNMAWMFAECNQLTSIDVSHFNTSQVTDMSGMFQRLSLTSLDLSSFNTSQVTGMFAMFSRSSNLRTVYVGNGWSTAAVTNSTYMFNDCVSLVGGQGTTYNASNPMDKTYAHIDGGTSNPGYFTAKGPEAYACYTESNTTLTFYYDNYRSSRLGVTYDLNAGGTNNPGWKTDGTNARVTKVVFDSSFAGARPTTTFSWFNGMENLQSITGMSYLNTSEVTSMGNMFYKCSNLTSLNVSQFNTSKVTVLFGMFYNCSSLTSLDLSSFNTSLVTSMGSMFYGCSNLQTIYAGDGWSTAAVTVSSNMFKNCTSLVGGQGTTYSDSNPLDKTYAHIDGGPSNPGYFTGKNTSLRGDVNGDGSVNISDVTALIDYLLSGNASGINMSGADTNQDGSINIADVTALIDLLLNNETTSNTRMVAN